MTLIADINSMTMTAYDATSVAAAAVQASAYVVGIRGSYTYGDDATVDLGAAMLGARILDRGKNSYEARNSETPVPIDNFQALVTKEIKGIILYDTSKYRYSTSITSTKYTDSPSKS